MNHASLSPSGKDGLRDDLKDGLDASQNFSGESGQGTTEYILILTFAVVAALTVKRTLQPVLDSIAPRLEERFDTMLFPKGGEGFHQLRFGR